MNGNRYLEIGAADDQRSGLRRDLDGRNGSSTPTTNVAHCMLCDTLPKAMTNWLPSTVGLYIRYRRISLTLVSESGCAGRASLIPVITGVPGDG